MPRTVHQLPGGAVVACTDCPGWWADADDKLDGWRVARDHERRVHRGDKQALRALNAARWRADRRAGL